MDNKTNPVRGVVGFLTVAQAASYVAYREHRLSLARESGISGGIEKCLENLAAARLRLEHAKHREADGLAA